MFEKLFEIGTSKKYQQNIQLFKIKINNKMIKIKSNYNLLFKPTFVFRTEFLFRIVIQDASSMP